VLDAVRNAAAKAGIWVHIGSLAVQADGERWANRAFVINPAGEIAARYDKMHMFDVDLASGETWRRNPPPIGRARRWRRWSARLGGWGWRSATTFAFLRCSRNWASQVRRDCHSRRRSPRPPAARTGHWLQRARAVEASAFVISAAQAGRHEDGRETYGHSLVVDPWGRGPALTWGTRRSPWAFWALPISILPVRARSRASTQPRQPTRDP